MGEGILFTGSCRLLGVGTVYVTSLDNSSDVLFGVRAASFIFRRRVAFLFRVAAAYVMCGEILVVFPPLVLVQCSVVAMEVMVETKFLAPLVLLQGASFLVDCRQVRP